MNKGIPDSSFNANEITLKFLANNVYQELMEKKDKNPSSEDCAFYKKRILNMVKNMLNGIYPSDSVKEAHMYYVNVLIEHMKVHDRVDILQKEYPKVSFDIPSTLTLDDECVVESNKMMMKPTIHVPTLDDFIHTKIVKIKEPIVYPVKKEIDIKTEEHKIKGIKIKNTLNQNKHV